MKLIVAPLLSCIAIFVVLTVSEMLWRHKTLRGEAGRKLVHMSVGSFVAFWPFFMSWNTILVLSIAFFLVISISYHYKIFHAIHTVKRKTWGELAFAAAIGMVALITQNEWIYAIAILHLSLSDGIAALVGTRFGRKNTYKVFNHVRSIAGTSAFLSVSVVLVAVFILLQPEQFGHAALPIIIWLPLLATLLENVSVHGTDNIVVPVFVALVLSSLQLYA